MARLSRRRFTVAVAIGGAVAAVPFLWTLWSLWGAPSPIRSTVYEANFYDLQTRAIFHGHLWLANGAIGIEAFVHGGHEYTYFGLFPSLLRIPILLVTSRFDGKLSAPSLLTAWTLTGVLAAMLMWRVRILIRGETALGRLEAVALGVLEATILSGTVFVLLASTPYVFSEDIAWSICLTVGSLFALLGVVERPSWGRIILSFVFVLAANLDRATTGWACVVAAVLIGIWFGIGRLRREQRRWCLPLIGVGVIPLLVGCAVNYAKFGVLFGVSNFEQIWTHVNAYRRVFLAANHNAEEGVIFVPSNLLAYLRPDGIRWTPNFPFVTLPGSPPAALGGVLFDRRYRTASLTASSPLLVALSIWGLIVAFKPRPVGRVALTRILLLSAGAAGAALLLWGYIAPRYLGDFVPFLVLAGAVGMIDIWRRLGRRTRLVGVVALFVISSIAAYSILANVGMSSTPSEEWTTAQVLNYAQAQKSVADLTGVSLRSEVHRGAVLPPYAPADQYFIIGNCDGLYISNGEDYSTVPREQFPRMTWMTVELGHSFEHAFTLMAGSNGSSGAATDTQTLVTIGHRSIFVRAEATPSGRHVRLTFGRAGGGEVDYGTPVSVATGSSHRVTVVTDPAKRMVQVSLDDRPLFGRTVPVGRPIRAVATASVAPGQHPLLTFKDVTASTPAPTLCRSLIQG